MKSITVHNLDTETAKAIERLAATTGLSQNKVIKKLLRTALGLGESGKPKADFSAFNGLWSVEEADGFEQAIEPINQIDEELWK